MQVLALPVPVDSTLPAFVARIERLLAGSLFRRERAGSQIALKIVHTPSGTLYALSDEACSACWLHSPAAALTLPVALDAAPEGLFQLAGLKSHFLLRHAYTVEAAHWACGDFSVRIGTFAGKGLLAIVQCSWPLGQRPAALVGAMLQQLFADAGSWEAVPYGDAASVGGFVELVKRARFI